jgi:hypothetical protein
MIGIIVPIVDFSPLHVLEVWVSLDFFSVALARPKSFGRVALKELVYG